MLYKLLLFYINLIYKNQILFQLDERFFFHVRFYDRLHLIILLLSLPCNKENNLILITNLN